MVHDIYLLLIFFLGGTLDILFLVISAGFLQGLGVVVVGVLIYLLGRLLGSGVSREKILLSGLVFCLSLMATVFLLSILFIEIFSLVPLEILRVVAIALGVFVFLVGLLGLVAELSDKEILRFMRINPLSRSARGIGRGRGLYISSAALGFLGGLANISCPCALPLIPAVYLYIVSSQIHSSVEIALLYSFSNALPSLIIFSTIYVKRIFRVIYDYVRLRMRLIRIIFSSALIVIGFLIVLFS